MEKLVNPVQFAWNAKFLVVARHIPGLSDKRYIETIYMSSESVLIYFVIMYDIAR